MVLRVYVKRFIIFIVLFLHGYLHSSPNYVKYTNQITSQFIKEMRREYNLFCSGTGGGMPYDVREVAVIFVSHQEVSIEEAREMLVHCTEALRSKINTHEKIRPFLREYPFPAERVEITISFRDEKNQYYGKEGVDFVFQVNGKIHYEKFQRGRETFKGIAEEPYEEALKIVRGKESSRL